MPKSIAKVTRTTARKDLLDIMLESKLFSGRKQARECLGAVSVALRAWLVAMTARPPKNVMSRLTVPGVGAFRIGWYEYGDGRQQVRCRFTLTDKARKQVRAVNKEAYFEWSLSNPRKCSKIPQKPVVLQNTTEKAS